MRVLILTSSRRGFASLAVPVLVQAGIDIAMVVYCDGSGTDRAKERRRKLKKLLRIGLLGTINGLRIRPWFSTEVADRLQLEPIEVVAQRNAIRFERTPMINCRRTRDLFHESGAGLGLSLGNSYIGQKVFSIPRFGMLNVHHELLPQYQGAQSVIWQIYEGSSVTGYTIHQVDAGIDTGRILYQEQVPIQFAPTLQATVVNNYSNLYLTSARQLGNVISRYYELAGNALSQGGGRKYTTPTIWQFLRMVLRHRKMYQCQSKC